jgi:hypothetical protein
MPSFTSAPAWRALLDDRDTLRDRRLDAVLPEDAQYLDLLRLLKP